MSDVILVADGKQYGGWKTIRIQRGIEQIAGIFELSISERWAGQTEVRRIRPGMECTITIDGEAVITGYVDTMLPGYNNQSHDVTVTGRDKTGDLVDCSVVGAVEWKNRTLLQLAQTICKPFGIPVAADVDVGGAYKTASSQPGETAFEAVERAARMRGVMLVADGVGGLRLTRAASTRISTILQRGKNILAADGMLSWQDRFSHYIVKGDDQGSDWSTPEQNAQPSGSAIDKGVTRYRPLVILAETAGDGAKMAERAKWEAAVRFGRSTRASVQVVGWRHVAGLWQPNTLVRVTDDWLDIDRDMLIASVSLTYDEGGELCLLEVVPPEAFKMLALPETEESALWG